MLDIYSWVIAALVIFFAAALQSISGFGFSLFAVPFLVLIFDPKTAVGLNIIISFFSTTVLTLKVRQHIIKSMVKNLFIGALFGLPLGIYVFTNFDMEVLKIIITVITLILSLSLIFSIQPRIATTPYLEKIVGFFSGVLTGSVGIPGPPIIFFLSNQGLSKDNFRATTANYFALIYPSSLLILIALGGVDKFIIINAIILLPFALLGGALGRSIFPYISQASFQRGIPLLLLANALYSLSKLIF